MWNLRRWLTPLPPTPGQLARFGTALFFAYVLLLTGMDGIDRLFGGDGWFTAPAGDDASLFANLAARLAIAGLTVLSGTLLGWLIGFILLLARKFEAEFLNRV